MNEHEVKQILEAVAGVEELIAPLTTIATAIANTLERGSAWQILAEVAGSRAYQIENYRIRWNAETGLLIEETQDPEPFWNVLLIHNAQSLTDAVIMAGQKAQKRIERNANEKHAAKVKARAEAAADENTVITGGWAAVFQKHKEEQEKARVEEADRKAIAETGWPVLFPEQESGSGDDIPFN